jgi:hypothetical protein
MMRKVVENTDEPSFGEGQGSPESEAEMLSDVGVQDVRECGSNVERDRVGEQNQKRTIRHIGDHQPRGHDPAGMGSNAYRVKRSGNRLGLSSLEKMHQNLLSVSLVIRHRAMLIFWRAYEQNSSQRPDETL